jgi:hypothetical protein
VATGLAVPFWNEVSSGRIAREPACRPRWGFSDCRLFPMACAMGCILTLLLRLRKADSAEPELCSHLGQICQRSYLIQ